MKASVGIRLARVRHMTLNVGLLPLNDVVQFDILCCYSPFPVGDSRLVCFEDYLVAD